MKKRIELLMLLGCMMLPTEQVQASSPLFFGGHGESASPTSVATINFDEKLSQDQIIQFLEQEFAEIKTSDDINIPLFARIIGPMSYTEILVIIAMAESFSIKNNNEINMQNLEDAYVNMKYGMQRQHNNTSYTMETAIHEAGHVVARIYRASEQSVLYSVTVTPRMHSSGITLSNKLMRLQNYNYNNYRNNIMVLLSGGIAQQFFGLPKLFEGKNLVALLHDQGCVDDIKDAYDIAYIMVKMKLVMLNNDAFIKSEVDKIIAECYEIVWDFVIQHAEDVRLIADLLVEKGTVSGDEIYNMLGVDKPLYDFESGPLPQGITGNYVLRGYVP